MDVALVPGELPATAAPLPETVLGNLRPAEPSPEARWWAVRRQSKRRVPTVEQLWVDDKIDVKALLSKNFSCKAQGLLSQEMTTELLSKIAFWAAYQRA